MDKSLIDTALNSALKAMQASVLKERARLLASIREDYKNKFHSEGLSFYHRSIEDHDDFFKADYEEIRKRDIDENN